MTKPVGTVLLLLIRTQPITIIDRQRMLLFGVLLLANWSRHCTIITTVHAFPLSPLTTNHQLSTTRLFGVRGKKIRREKRRAMQAPTPPRIETPYGPIRFPQPPRVCECCQGRGIIRCEVCQGKGVVRATGTRKRNTIDANRLVGSQWTAVQVYNGHRHYTVMETRGSPKQKTEWQARMRNCCGEADTDVWISIEEELKEKDVWRKGWETLADIEKAQGGALWDAKVCFLCKGGRILHCIDCDGRGSIPSYEPLYND